MKCSTPSVPSLTLLSLVTTRTAEHSLTH
jgi:hypothetical protein